IQVVRKWLDGGCPSWAVPVDQIRKLCWALAALEAELAALRKGWEQQPVAYPKIMYCCEYCSERNPEICGYDRRDIYVTNDGRWLCDGCLDAEGISSRECSLPPLLYTHPAPQTDASGVSAVGWIPLTEKNDVMTCSMPSDETVVEVMLK